MRRKAPALLRAALLAARGLYFQAVLRLMMHWAKKAHWELAVGYGGADEEEVTDIIIAPEARMAFILERLEDDG